MKKKNRKFILIVDNKTNKQKRHELITSNAKTNRYKFVICLCSHRHVLRAMRQVSHRVVVVVIFSLSLSRYDDRDCVCS